MRYAVNVSNTDYIVNIEKLQIKKRREIDEKESKKTIFSPSLQENISEDICFSVVQAEYEHAISRSAKLDNKVYILLTVCAFIFVSLTNYISKISAVKEVNERWKPVSVFWQLYYPTAVYMTVLLFVITLVLLIFLLSNINMIRFDSRLVIDKNLVSLSKKQVIRFICSKYVQATMKNMDTLKIRYKIFNFTIFVMILTIIALIFLSIISNLVVFDM